MAAVKVIMPVLGMNQETGLVLKWLVKEGEAVKKGQILMEIETDKAVAEIDAPADGVLTQILAQEGESVPVGQAAALITPPGEKAALKSPTPASIPAVPLGEAAAQKSVTPLLISASPVAERMAAEHRIDLSAVRATGGRIEKADILAYLQARSAEPAKVGEQPARTVASPKARRLAAERGLDLRTIHGSGPQGAVLAPDVEAFGPPSSLNAAALPARDSAKDELTLSSAGRIMAERTSATWQTTPHFYLLREVDAGQLLAWRESAQKDSKTKITLTDLLIKLCAASLVRRPALNVQFMGGKLLRLPAVHIGFAAAVEDGRPACRMAPVPAHRPGEDGGRLRPQEILPGPGRAAGGGLPRRARRGLPAAGLLLDRSPEAAVLRTGYGEGRDRLPPRAPGDPHRRPHSRLRQPHALRRHKALSAR